MSIYVCCMHVYRHMYIGVNMWCMCINDYVYDNKKEYRVWNGKYEGCMYWIKCMKRVCNNQLYVSMIAECVSMKEGLICM